MKLTPMQEFIEYIKTHNGLTKSMFEDAIVKYLSLEKEMMKILYSHFLIDKRTGEMYDFEEYYKDVFTNKKATD